MQEVTISTPDGQGEKVARLAVECGLTGVTIARIHAFEEDRLVAKEEVKAAVAAPQATCFVEAVMGADFYDPRQYNIVCDEVMAIVGEEAPRDITRPMRLPSVNVLQELWQENHINAAYLARAGVSSVLLAYGLLAGEISVLLIALLLAPFLSQVLGIAFGGWARDWTLARQGATVLGLSTLIGVTSGAITAAVMGGPIQIESFGSLQSNFAISVLVGILAGLDTADEAGRREFVAVAGAAQFASFPVWFGIALVVGFPDPETTMWRVASFAVNIITMLVVSLVVYVALRYRREAIARYAVATAPEKKPAAR